MLCLVITALSSLGQYVAIPDGDCSAEYWSAMGANTSSNLLAIVLILRTFQKSFFDTWEESELFAAAPRTFPALLIFRAIGVADCLALTTGFGPPYEGDDLKAGSQQFTALHEQLNTAFPNSGSWQGSGTLAYTDQLGTLRGNAQRMAELDLELKALMKDQADWVTHMRLGFGILNYLLIVAMCATNLVVMEWITVPGYYNAVTLAASSCTLLACTLAAGMVGGLAGVSADKQKTIDRKTDEYQDLGAVLSSTEVQTQVTAVQETRIAGFEAISANNPLSRTTKPEKQLADNTHRRRGTDSPAEQASIEVAVPAEIVSAKAVPAGDVQQSQPYQDIRTG